ncbi:cell surface protein [Acidovorax radicis]|uniref:cell surface protein n=1 Tax=Acidovorax radicis TaxID=758826 RepID=UPI001CF945CF|nr:cell surface protein [Acidovorax radicis]UCU99850.1 cell surface protein [Acidovorax radicis]
MKKNVLALSIAAMVGGFAGVAQADVFAPGAAATGAVLGTNVAAEPGVAGAVAVNATVLEVNSNNVGHMLVVPYYTAQNGNMSVIHLSNTDRANGKAVKIRFRGAANSDDVKDFQLFLSPGDVWTGAVLQGADGAAVLYSADKSCTVPAIPATGTAFATARLNATTNVNGTREGYVEIFNMADIPSVKLYTSTQTSSGTVAGAAGTANSVLYTAIKHASGVAPCSVAGSASRTLLDEIAMTNYTAAAHAASVGFGAATTGLSADWYILNLAQTTAFSGSATAIEARVAAAGAAGAANYVHFPQTDAGSGAFFATANKSADTYTADPLLRTLVNDFAKASVTGPVVTPLFIDLPDMSTPYLAAQAPAGAAGDANLPKLQAVALTAALSRTSVSNQYALDTGISAQTDWVFSMPTRRYSVAANYKAATTSAANYRLYSDLSVIATGPALPVVAAATHGLADEWFYPGNTQVDSRGNICVNADAMRFFDREETTTGNAPIFSPAVASQLALCGETSVLSFSSGKVLGSSSDLTATTMASPYVNGWTLVSTANAFVGANNTNAFTGGLPILGDAFIKMKNDSAAQGFASTFGLTWGHRYGR